MERTTFGEWIEVSRAMEDRDMAHCCSLGFTDEILVANVLRLAKTFEDYVLVLEVMREHVGYDRDHTGYKHRALVSPCAGQELFDRLIGKADTFSRCQTAFNLLGQATWGIRPRPYEDRAKIHAEVLRERASHLATTFVDWLWVAENEGHPRNWERYDLAIERMKGLASNVEEFAVLISKLDQDNDDMYKKLIDLIVER